MLASMNSAALRDPRVVRFTYALGTYTTDGNDPWPGGPTTTTDRVTLSKSGDLRAVSIPVSAAPGTAQVHTYDAQRHEARWINGSLPVNKITSLEITRPAWDSSGSSSDWGWGFYYLTALSGWVRWRLSETDADTPVTRTTYLGRPAWHAVLHERLTSKRAVDWSVTVDQETGLVLRSLELEDSLTPGVQVVEEFRVTRFEVNPELEPGWNTISPVGRERIGIIDDATRFGSPEEIARRSAPTPVLIPTWTPRGYRLTDVADTGHPGMGDSSQSRLIYFSRHHPRKYLRQRIGVDPARQHVAIRFRRGFSTFDITVFPPRGSHGDRAKLKLPYAEPVTLHRGLLAGEQARIGVAPFLGQPPTLVALKDGYRITITGDLTRNELVAVAESLQQRGK
jgi:hypothetical protein